MDYANPFASAAEETQAVCSVVVKVCAKEGELQYEATGKGATKKLAKQGAAARAVVHLFPQLEDKLKAAGLLDDVLTEALAATPASTKRNQCVEEWAKNNAAMVLQRHCDRQGLMLDYKYVEDGPAHAKVFNVTAIVAEEEKGKSTGSKKKAAQAMAALDALNNLGVDVNAACKELTNSEGMVEGGGGEARAKRKREGGGGEGEEVLPGKEGLDEDGYEARMMTRDRIKVLHIFCQMAKPTALSLELKVTEDGPPHNKTFTVDAIVDGESKALASATKKKLAQMQAAEAAIEELKIDVPTLVSEYLATLPAKVSIKLARAKTARMQTN